MKNLRAIKSYTLNIESIFTCLECESNEVKACLSVNRWSGVYENDHSNYGPQLALTPPSSTGAGYWHSGGEKHPWIEFGMDEETEVDRIKIIDRLDCCPERFENVEVRVGLKWSVNSVSCGVQSYKGSTTYIFNCPTNARGNHIFINKHGTTTNWFHINNVVVSKRSSAGKLDPELIRFIIVKPKSSPKSKSKIQVQNPKSKVKRKGTGTGADNIIQQATTPPTTHH